MPVIETTQPADAGVLLALQTTAAYSSPAWIVLGMIFFTFSLVYCWARGNSVSERGTVIELTPLIRVNPMPARDARAFMIVSHERYGFLVMTAYKERKGHHGQLPGGRMDLGEDGAASAVRELFEETGMLVDSSRVKYLWPIGNKHFYFLQINDDDQIKGGQVPASGENFKLKLSDEHNGFAFYKDVHAAARAVLRHSGGTPASALERFSQSV